MAKTTAGTMSCNAPHCKDVDSGTDDRGTRGRIGSSTTGSTSSVSCARSPDHTASWTGSLLAVARSWVWSGSPSIDIANASTGAKMSKYNIGRTSRVPRRSVIKRFHTAHRCNIVRTLELGCRANPNERVARPCPLDDNRQRAGMQETIGRAFGENLHNPSF